MANGMAYTTAQVNKVMDEYFQNNGARYTDITGVGTPVYFKGYIFKLESTNLATQWRPINFFDPDGHGRVENQPSLQLNVGLQYIEPACLWCGGHSSSRARMLSEVGCVCTDCARWEQTRQPDGTVEEQIGNTNTIQNEIHNLIQNAEDKHGLDQPELHEWLPRRIRDLHLAPYYSQDLRSTEATLFTGNTAKETDEIIDRQHKWMDDRPNTIQMGADFKDALMNDPDIRRTFGEIHVYLIRIPSKRGCDFLHDLQDARDVNHLHRTHGNKILAYQRRLEAEAERFFDDLHKKQKRYNRKRRAEHRLGYKDSLSAEPYSGN